MACRSRGCGVGGRAVAERAAALTRKKEEEAKAAEARKRDEEAWGDRMPPPNRVIEAAFQQVAAGLPSDLASSLALGCSCHGAPCRCNLVSSRCTP